jgi:hypothetical protein
MRRVPRFVLVAALLSGCSVTMPGGLGKASTPVGQRPYTVLGRATGTSKGTFVFGIQTSKPTVDEAITRAVQTRGGDALINISTMQRETTWVLLPVATVEVRATGDVIRFTAPRP